MCLLIPLSPRDDQSTTTSFTTLTWFKTWRSRFKTWRSSLHAYKLLVVSPWILQSNKFPGFRCTFLGQYSYFCHPPTWYCNTTNKCLKKENIVDDSHVVIHPFELPVTRSILKLLLLRICFACSTGRLHQKVIHVTGNTFTCCCCVCYTLRKAFLQCSCSFQWDIFSRQSWTVCIPLRMPGQ